MRSGWPAGKPASGVSLGSPGQDSPNRSADLKGGFLDPDVDKRIQGEILKENLR
jgi:hypothetical protein